MNIRRFFASFGITLLCAVLIVASLGYFWLWPMFQGQSVGEEVSEEIIEVLDDVENTKTRRNVLVIGVDKSGVLADVMMICSFSHTGNPINLMSVQRDTVVVVNGRKCKINEVLQYGEDVLISTVKEVTGIPVHDYVRVNFKAVKTIVDELGGVQFTVPQNMQYKDPEQDLYIDLQAGNQLLNGDKALQLLRFRGYEMADIQRTKVQRDFIWAMFQQHATISNIDKVSEVYGAVQDNVRSNLEWGDLLVYLDLANGCELQTFSMPYEIGGGISGAVTVKQDEMESLAKAYFIQN